jgi:hypothetical protein
LVSSLACTGSILASSSPLEIGGDSISGQFFCQHVDEVRAYNVALTDTQMAANMQTPIQ